ncbi:MAG: ABC transporter ATP-binding protein [Candidatus Aminicenantes bacterium]|nr:ABC transporter ATP-binding protein [Candidatus Aminicenantes bacterium]
MIEIKALTKMYGRGPRAVAALRGIDLEIGRGMFGLLGPNGAGKTTLMRILAGIVRAASGGVRVDGHDLATEAGRLAVKSILGYLPQELGLYPDLTARRFVDYMALLKGVEPERRTRRVGEMLEAVGLSRDADRKIKEFSGGMKRRVGIAQALVNDPRLLIVDEPTAGLDPEERIRFRNLLVELALDRAVILSTHIVEDIGQTCRTMAVLAKGKLLYHGSPRELAAAAEGSVWTVLSPDGRKPDGGTVIVSMIHLAEGVQYRLVGPRPDGFADVGRAAPGLEDGYVRLMRSADSVSGENG